MYKTINQIKRANKAAGCHWFNPGALEFFKSRVEPNVWPVADGAYFASSECGPDGRRKWSVRFADAQGSIDTVADFGLFATVDDAKRFAATCAADGFDVADSLACLLAANPGDLPFKAAWDGVEAAKASGDLLACWRWQRVRTALYALDAARQAA
jgi:hypothetical protein